jgi:hypothetical protein
MPHGLHPNEFIPVTARRKRFVQQGGLGGELNGLRPNSEIHQYQCAHCHKDYTWSTTLESTDFGDVVDNLCPECRTLLRSMRTNHPEMK